MRISSFRVKAHLVFYWCLYNKSVLTVIRVIGVISSRTYSPILYSSGGSLRGLFPWHTSLRCRHFSCFPRVWVNLCELWLLTHPQSSLIICRRNGHGRLLRHLSKEDDGKDRGKRKRHHFPFSLLPMSPRRHLPHPSLINILLGDERDDWGWSSQLWLYIYLRLTLSNKPCSNNI